MSGYEEWAAKDRIAQIEAHIKHCFATGELTVYETMQPRTADDRDILRRIMEARAFLKALADNPKRKVKEAMR